jgi:hypothetical protein
MQRSGRRVPVEHRFFGLDQRTIPFAAAAAAVWLLWAIVLPQIDERIAWDDPIRAGQRIQVTDDVTFAPAEGWGLLSGLRTTDVTSSGVRSAPLVALTNNGSRQRHARRIQRGLHDRARGLRAVLRGVPVLPAPLRPLGAHPGRHALCGCTNEKRAP